MLKELLYTGVGVATIIKDKVEDEITKLEEKGKIKKDDAKSFMETIQSKGEEEDARIKENMKTMLKEIIDELGIATKDDLEKLKEELKK
jgi:polyhydroxyalkanoate synthesis regulator phasin